MFRRLHIGLTLLYLLAGFTLLALIGVGTYQLIDHYFQTTMDLALQHKMAHEFVLRKLPLPAELVAADRNWYATRGQSPLTRSEPAADTPSATGVPTLSGKPQTLSAQDDNGQDKGVVEEPGDRDQLVQGDSVDEVALEDAYIGELASIFTLSLDANGQVISTTTTNSPTPPIAPDQGAVTSALQGGIDWRTVTLDARTRVRLLTYRLPTSATDPSNGSPSPAVLQLGRALVDQDRVLEQLLGGLLGLGGISLLLLALSSWWLAGRSLRPAEQAWERQQLFVANASHELRAPLTLMRASTEVTLRTLPITDADHRTLMEDVLQECDHMTRLVEDLLLLSRLDAGRLKFESRPIFLREMLSDVQRQVSRLADEHGVRLLVDGIGDVGDLGGVTDAAYSAGLLALGDSTRLRQVLLAVLDNALLHTPRGGSIEITSRRHGRYVQICVADTGSGIEPEHLPHIFERFYQAENSRGGSNSGEGTVGGGSGLGLAIAKGLIDGQHGRIAISSQPGQGTRVTLSLPGVAQ